MYIVFKCEEPNSKTSMVSAAFLMQSSPSDTGLVGYGTDTVFVQTDNDDLINKCLNAIDHIRVTGHNVDIKSSITCEVTTFGYVDGDIAARRLNAFDDRVRPALERAAATTSLKFV